MSGDSLQIPLSHSKDSIRLPHPKELRYHLTLKWSNLSIMLSSRRVIIHNMGDYRMSNSIQRISNRKSLIQLHKGNSHKLIYHTQLKILLFLLKIKWVILQKSNIKSYKMSSSSNYQRTSKYLPSKTQIPQILLLHMHLCNHSNTNNHSNTSSSN